ncbi:MAG: tRNA (adenosine(37)-N6)-dimethylallyltransferase MiaA, partial [Muribaculaceae bacterium]|nr:tRNA (adenosine(37)-N6)-dimethylallyltransferase MiaA [Muribaculaceae bacterium]
GSTGRSMLTVNVVTGPTASAKTAAAIDLAESLGCEIISADSRQIYRHIPITTACPTPEELARVPHHLVQSLELTDYYSAACFEQDALRLIADMESRGRAQVVVCGGSMMYINALLVGLDELPTISESVRAETLDFFLSEGIEGVRRELQRLDPAYLAQADPNNHRRLVHALEIIRQSGSPVSALRTGRRKQRPFRVRLSVLEPPRAELFDRINRRVEKMVADGMVDEARSVYHLRHLNSLNTVGFKELFAYFDGVWDLPTAIARIQKNTRVYAKKQLTYLSARKSLWTGSPITL